ncbi:metabolite-proton symporter [Streptosporangium becharense]|uniref:Putative proline/betaine transporter n=1 Tax=Streptosporangium becharense TaxID=1816182 RepID=A0A7W9ILD1_9ACTN|nr:MFS transporter [Streptosporangium becharense]MBB2913265.1 metabolite-proton symporter [Streptosporangium becharense]MBB5822248.1 metabolite-proton symporter [Streptosporangium becharense]
MDTDRRQAARRVSWATFIGTTIEWYDFFLYGTAAALVFNKQFFPAMDPVAGSIAAFGTMTVGFLARPLGGIVFGHFGDRIGRRNTLVVSLLIMGIGTTLIGLLPTYSSIGVWAAVLLVVMRVAQGIGLGGELGGAVVLTMEHAPKGRRGLFGAFPMMGTPAGMLCANLVFLGTSSLLGEESFMAWGWRVPFLLSIVLVGVGLYLRLQIEESPDYENLVERREPVRLPIAIVLRDHWRGVLHTIAVIIGNSSIAYVFMVYILNYGQAEVGLSRTYLLTCVIGGAAVWLATAPLWAHLGDRRGLRAIFTWGSVVLLAGAVAILPVVETGDTVLIAVFMVAMGAVLAMTHAPQGTLTASFFPVAIRYSGTSVAYQMASLLGGGITPLIAASLYASTGTSLSITGYLTAVAAVSLVAALVIPRNDAERLGDRPLADIAK